jgi:serine/threonine-protein kinase SRPK3
MISQELVGQFPSYLLVNAKHAGQYFNRKGELRHIHNLNFWPLRDVFIEKYKMSVHDAEDISSFLEAILQVQMR